MRKEYRKYLVWFIMSSVFMVSLLQRFAAGVLQKDLTAEFSLSPAGFGWLASSYLYVYMAMQFAVGPLMDIRGVRGTTAAGALVACAGSFIFGFSISVPMLFIGRILIAIGFAGAYVACVKINAVNFAPRQFATMMGRTSFIGQTGSVLSQAPLAWLLTFVGWRGFFIIAGAMSFVMAILVWEVAEPEQNCSPQPKPKLQKASCKEILLKLTSVVSIRFMPLVILNSICGQGISIMLAATWGVPFLKDAYSMSLIKASGVMFWFLTGQMLGCPLIGVVSDYLRSRKNVFIAVNTIGAAIFLRIFLIGPLLPLGLLPVLFAVMGVCSSQFIIRIAIGKELCGPQRAASGFSVCNAGTFLGAAVFTTVCGEILGYLQGNMPVFEAYKYAFMPASAATVLFAASSFLLPETYGKNQSD